MSQALSRLDRRRFAVPVVDGISNSTISVILLSDQKGGPLGQQAREEPLADLVSICLHEK